MSINLDLQGGGAHGAFTWGVLDRLLEDERIRFDRISATSAGAMNATALAAGKAADGHEGAKKALGRLWHQISRAALTSPLRPPYWNACSAITRWRNRWASFSSS
jgi:NTE family protein